MRGRECVREGMCEGGREGMCEGGREGGGFNLKYVNVS